LYNIKRINHQHYFYNINHKLVIPLNQKVWGEVVLPESIKQLNKPDIIIELVNFHADIVHFFEVELKSYKDKIVKIVINEDANYGTFKSNIKILLNKQMPPYMTMKAVNDIILSKIVYCYSDYNYAYEISKNNKRITFIIQMT
jgi:hypothetical protein